MKSKKVKTTTKSSPRTSEEDLSTSNGNRNAFSFLKNRFFTATTTATTNQQNNNGPRPSTSSNRSTSKPWSIDTKNDVIADKPISKSFEEHSISEFNTSSSTTTSSSASNSKAQNRNTRPMSMMGLDSLTNNPADKDASIVVRRNQSTMATDNIGMATEKRASLTTLKEGYLFKKTDFKPFHKQNKLDRGWKLYRVVLKGHKLYLYKLTSESPLRSLFPTNHQLRQLPASLTSISNSSTSSSMHNSPIQLSPGIATVRSTPADTTKIEKSDFDRDAQQLFFHTLPSTAQGTIFMELNPVTMQPNKQIYLVLFNDMLYILNRPDTTSSLWKIEKKFALEQIHLEHCNKPLIETPTSPASTSSMQSETIHDWSFNQMFFFSVYNANQLIGVFSTQNRDLGQTWINAFNTNMAILYDATQKLHPEIVLGCDRNHRTVVKGGTVHALVYQLLNHSTDQNYILVFLLTYATFTTGACILAQIKEILDMDTDADLRARVLDIFDIWCKEYALDVMGDIATGMMDILDSINTERASQVKELVLYTVAKNTKKTCEQTNKPNISPLSSALAPAENMPEEEDQVENITAYEENGKHRDSINLSNLLITGLTPAVFLMIDPTSFARQIYLFHFSKHQQFKDDLLNPLSYLPRPQISVQLSNSLLFTTAAPHFLTKLIRNHILIDTQQQSEQDQVEDCLLLRSRLLAHWIRIGAQLLTMGDMTGWSAIAMGICSVGIVRLRETWKAVDRTLVHQVQTTWTNILVDYGLYTQTMWFDKMPAITKVLNVHDLNNSTQGQSGLPFFGTIRQSVDRLRKHSNKLLIPNIINFEECQCIYNVITSSLDQLTNDTAIDASSQLPRAVNPLQSFFEHSVTDVMSVPHDYKYLQECSLACEPRIFGQGFDRRKFSGRQNNTTTPPSTANSDVAPPSINSLIFPAILHSCSLLETPQDIQQQQHGETGKIHSRKLGTNNSFRSLRSLLDDTPTNKKAKPYYSSSGQEVISPPRAANRKSFRRRTYSFPPGSNSSTTTTNNNHSSNNPKPSSRHDLSLDAENSRTWLGSLISSKYHRTYSTKALIEAHRKNRVAQYGQNGEILLNAQHGELVFKATALLRKEETKDDEEEGLLVTIKAGYLEQLVDSLVCGIAPYEHALKDQWQILSLTERLEQPTKIVMDLEEYIHVFFMTFRIYCSSTHLLDMLQKRFIEAKFKCKSSVKKKNSLTLLESYFNHTTDNSKSDPPTTDISNDDEMTAYDWKKVAKIQLAVLDLLLFWTDEHPYDFIDEIEATRYICNFLKNAQDALQSWRAPLIIKQQSRNNEEALHLATLIDQRFTQLYQQFICKSICPNYDMKALSFDASITGGTESLYCQLTSGTQRFHTTLQLVAGTNPVPLSISNRPRSADAKGLVDTFAPEPLLEHVDRTVRQLFYAVTLQDWIQTFDVFEAQSSDLYAWLPARKASRTSRMATCLAPVVDAPLTHVADYHVSPDEVIISDVFTMIEGARRSVVSPSAFSDDDLLLALPGSVQHLYCMHFIIRSWVINEITAVDLEPKTRVLRIERFLQMVVCSKSSSEKLALFPDLSVHGRVPGFVEYAIASALVSPEVRMFSKAWNDVAMQYGHANLDTLENLVSQMQKARPNLSPSSSSSSGSGMTRTFSASSTFSAFPQQQQQQSMVPSLGWVFERIMELCFHVPDTFENKDNLINFDKRRCVYQFLKLMLSIQADLDEHQQSECKGISMSFLISPNQSKYTWKDLKELSIRENKRPSSNGSSGSLGLRGSSTKSYSSKYTVFNKLVTEQLEKLKRDIKERDRIDKEWLSLQHKLQKKQLEQARLVEKQDRKAGINNHNSKQQSQQQSQQQQQHVMPRLNSFLRGLRTQSMVASPLQHIFPVNLNFDAQQPHLATTKASTVINLIHVTTSVASTYTKRDHVFRIVTEEGGQYLFQGMNRQDMLDWMHVINTSAREGAAKRQSVLAAESSASSIISMDHHHSAASSFNQRNQPASRTSVYGVALDNLMRDGQVPLVVDKCIREIERRGLEEVGIYRVAGTGSVVSALKQAFNRDVSRVDLSDPDWADINVVADAFKQFLRELPEPLLTYTYYDEFINASASEDHDERVYLIKKVIKKLPHSNYALLKRIIEHFVIVTDFEAINHMYATNLAIVFGPTLLQPTPGPASFATTMSNLGHHQNIVKYLILNYHYLFDVECDETDPLCCKEDEVIEATATSVAAPEAENTATPTNM